MSADVVGSGQVAVPGEFYVAMDNMPIMGRDLQQQLGVTVSRGNVVCQVQQDQELPAIKGFVNTVRMVPGAVPSPVRLRSLPYAVRQVSDHLKSLEAQGVIEKVPFGSSPWLSPIVAVRKRGGHGLRVCIDLTAVNKSPVHGTCVWLCVLCLGVQTGNDVRESGRRTMGMTPHCYVWLCLRWLKIFRHRDTGTKVVYFGAFVTICARRLCPESWRGEGTRCG